MRIEVVTGSLTAIEADAVVVNLFEGVQRPGGATGAVDREIGGALTRVIEAGDFRGKLGQTVTLYPEGKPFRRVIMVGLGPADSFTLEQARLAAAAAVKAAGRGGVRRLATIVHGAGIGGLDPEAAAAAVAEGSVLGAYRFDGYKGAASQGDDDENGSGRVEELHIVEMDEQKTAAIERGVRRGQAAAEATNFARDLVNTPPNRMTPADLAARAQAMAAEEGLECRVLERDEMERLGMGILLGVAQGSAQPPKLVAIRYEGAPGAPVLGLVGKGITFDSGGLSLKPPASMVEMKCDMAGAAAVLGAMKILARLRPEVNVLAVAPCVENMPSGGALRPGDVLTGMTGKSIEVVNTDAEGRLILADAVAYAAKEGAAAIVDCATLTGAVAIALGTVRTGALCNDDALYDLLEKASAETGERFWRLPADQEYREQYKSDVADLKNTGGRNAGTITGGLIIQEFVGDLPWLHLDIAATACAEKARGYIPKGGTGVAARTLAKLAELWGKEQGKK